MRDLTKAEEQIMQVLWQKEEAFVKEIIEELGEPKPAYSTVSTIVRILETKGFVGGGCREASKFMEEALGKRQQERMTSEFYQAQSVAQGVRQQS